MLQLNMQHPTVVWDMPIGVTLLTVQHSQTNLSLYPWTLMLILSDLITCAKPPRVALIHILQRATWSRATDQVHRWECYVIWL